VAFTLASHGILLVSDQADGSAGLQESLLRHHGKRVRSPQRPKRRPAPDFLGWHAKEVLKGEARQVEPHGV
jgi:putative restriction endonuclease